MKKRRCIFKEDLSLDDILKIIERIKEWKYQPYPGKEEFRTLGKIEYLSMSNMCLTNFMILLTYDKMLYFYTNDQMIDLYYGDYKFNKDNENYRKFKITIDKIKHSIPESEIQRINLINKQNIEKIRLLFIK